MNLPLRTRLLEAHPLLEETRHQVAVQRGPIVYCLESCDLPKDVTVSNVVIPRGTEWVPRFDSGLLGGVTVLEGKVESVSEAAWGKQLYRELAAGTSRTITVRLVPYYAWGNRGPSEMTVWLPRGR